MKRQPLISPYSKVFNFCFNLLDALSPVFKYFSSAKYRKLALIFKIHIYSYCTNVHFSLPRMGVIWKLSHQRQTEEKIGNYFSFCSFFFTISLKGKKKCNRKQRRASSALKFVRRSKTIMHIDFFKG